MRHRKMEKKRAERRECRAVKEKTERYRQPKKWRWIVFKTNKRCGY